MQLKTANNEFVIQLESNKVMVAILCGSFGYVFTSNGYLLGSKSFLETLYRPVDGNNTNDYRTHLEAVFGIPLLTSAVKQCR